MTVFSTVVFGQPLAEGVNALGRFQLYNS